MILALGKVLTILAVAFALGTTGLADLAWAQSTPGTWTHFPPQSTEYFTVVRPPIKANGSSVFANGSVIPVKFKLFTGPGVFSFDSVWSNNFPPEGGEGVSDDDFAFLSFAPSGPLTFGDITTLSADYSFSLGNCQGGSLRWSVTLDLLNNNGPEPGEGEPDPREDDRSIFIYYGTLPNFDDCTGANSQSGVNMINLSDSRYDTSQLGGTFYDTYANALALAGELRIAGVTLALDSGWMQDEFGNYQDQSVNLTRAQVNDAVFVPVSGDPTATCNLPQAAINVVEVIGGYVPNPFNVQRKFGDTFYRSTNECTYFYNLDTTTLFGPGDYAVYVTIDNQVIFDPGLFRLE